MLIHPPKRPADSHDEKIDEDKRKKQNAHFKPSPQSPLDCSFVYTFMNNQTMKNSNDTKAHGFSALFTDNWKVEIVFQFIKHFFISFVLCDYSITDRDKFFKMEYYTKKNY